MDRLACVDLPELPLQLLIRRFSDWKTEPVAVVDHDRPTGVIQCVNDRARARGVLPGMRYAAGLSLARDLRAGAVHEGEVDRAVKRVLGRLWCFSPHVEPAAGGRGHFWLDAAGLVPLYPSLAVWAAAVRDDLARGGFRSVVVVGYTRFGAYAAARSGTGVVVFRSADHERAAVGAVPIDRIGLEPALRDTLTKLGITTLAGFIDLPATGIRRRFGPAAHALHRFARGSGWTPLAPHAPVEPTERTIALEHPETDLDRLLARLGPLLASILDQLAVRDEALAELRFRFVLDDGCCLRERLSPAAPTLDREQLLGLIRLRMEALSFSAGVVDLTIRGTGASSPRRQLELFREAPHRDLEAVERAFARIRAELGNDRVVYARLREAHLPEARFGWQPVEKITLPRPTETPSRPLVRRLYSPPVQLPIRSRNEPDGWLVARMVDGPVEEVVGPYHVSGAWWGRGVARAYHYVRTRSGRWLWIYNDRRRRRWFLHGEVE